MALHHLVGKLMFDHLKDEVYKMQDFRLDITIDHLFDHISKAIQLGEADHAREATALLRVLLQEQRNRA